MVPQAKPLIAEFTKMSGAGNDFVVLDNRFYQFSGPELSAISRLICRRRHGIGADGVLALAEARSDECDYQMIYYNADGTEGTMCGNGARCIARYARSAGYGRRQVIIETASGAYRADVPPDEHAAIRIWFERPARWQASFDLHAERPEFIADLYFLWPGTEHVVCFTDSLRDIDVDVWGPLIRADRALMPAGANVNFVQVIGKNTLRVRTYEKGVEAETLACGTGAVASAAATRWSGRSTSEQIAVQMPGGTLHVGLQGDSVYLEGPAEAVYRGSIDIPSAWLHT